MRFARLLAGTVAAVLLLAVVSVSVAATDPTPNAVTIDAQGAMTVDGQPFKIKGVAYSIVPIGESERANVLGDYFTADYAYMWARDLPMLRSVGVNTLRIYSWDIKADHTAFLDACSQHDMKVFITHAIGYARDNPVDTVAKQDAIVKGFADEVARYGDHPAILMWSFGNEMNGYWLGFLDQFNTVYQCNWNSIQVEQGGCIRSTTPACLAAQDCIYSQYFGWLDRALAAGKNHTTRPMTATFADIDNIVGQNPQTDLLPRFAKNMTHFDAYAFQLYRGKTFYPPPKDGVAQPDYFSLYAAEAGGKPLIVAEYGLDALNDPCGWPENYLSMQPCTVYTPGQNGQPGGSDVPADPSSFVGCADNTLACHQPGVTSQAEWDANLASEIANAPAALGGFIFEWHDENWKNIETQDFCETPSSIADLAANTALLLSNEVASPYFYNSSDPDNAPKRTGAAHCTYKAHISCGNPDSTYQDVCGYFLWGAPDNYVNEAWFGLNKAQDCGDHVGSGTTASHHLTALTPRPALTSLTTVYGGSGSVTAFPTCVEMRPCWQCVTSHTAAQTAAGACNTECLLHLNHINEDLPADDESSSSSSGGQGGNGTVIVSSSSSSTGSHNRTEDAGLGGAAFATSSPLSFVTLAALALTMLFTANA